jgi:DNA-directed RNA polymerase subunit RPC12/RpoP
MKHTVPIVAAGVSLNGQEIAQVRFSMNLEIADMNTDVRRTVVCTRCQKQTPFSDVRMLEGGKMSCRACLGIVQQERHVERQKEQQMFDFQCLTCRYQFRRSAMNAPKHCPECGEHEFVKFDKGKLTGNTLLKLADDPRLERMEKFSYDEFRGRHA